MKVPVLHTGRDSFWRRRDPRVKWLLFFLLILLIYIAPDWTWMGAATLFGVLLAITARAPLGWLALLLLIQLPTILALLIIPMLGGDFRFDDEFRFGLRLALGWVAAILIGVSLFSTMDIDEMVQGLRGLGLPSGFAFVVGYAFVLIYLSVSDLGRVLDSMRLKGVTLSIRRPIAFVGGLAKLFIPALITIVRRGGSMTAALEARGIGSGATVRQRTRPLDGLDVLVAILGAACLVAAIVFRTGLYIG
ncbi:energy-coupling factor transporter transmembrane protein EcfT [Parasphingopyxis sp.]|uniref:energy-coupling factor transporter transmembrane component T family protein n=1 Tax=Parasphingopyxis sp. TaxID=1920299 RepID=UPI0026357B96|nr:energy-coupling factor transporter transmembrane component T [Parasphingopyxis sp.]